MMRQATVPSTLATIGRRVKFVLSFLALLASTAMFSQVATSYVFSQAVGTYTPITGGTQVATCTGTAASAATMVNTVYNLPAATIPFTFTYNFMGYTGLNISSNGYITFGATPPTSSSALPLSSTTGYDGAISAFAMALQGGHAIVGTRNNASTTWTAFTNTAGVSIGDHVLATSVATGATVTNKAATTVTLSAAATSAGTNQVLRSWGVNTALNLDKNNEIRYETIGTAPNRVFVIQWKGFRRSGTTATSIDLVKLNFQIRLYETSNKIEVVYGDCSVGNATTTTTTLQPQVGLRGPNNNFATEVNNRALGFDANWSASAPGAANNSVVGFSANGTGNILPNGLTYSWELPSCTWPTATATTTPNCMAGTYTVTVDLTDLGDAANVDIESSANGGVIAGGDNVVTGMYTTPPIALGTPTTITVVHNGNAQCNLSLGSFVEYTYNCPITVYPHCQTFDSFTTCSEATPCATTCQLELGWSNEPSTDNGDWRTWSGGTSTAGTGPSGDITGGGKYLYMESSSNSCDMVAYSPVFDLSTPNAAYGSEVSVHYSMNGSGIGTFTLEIESPAGSNSYTNLFTRSGNQGTQWNFTEWLDIGSYGPLVRFRITGVDVAASSNFGDMAFDEFCVRAAPSCPIPSGLSASNETPYGADLAWTENGPATTWDLEIVAENVMPSGTPTLQNVGNPYTWSAGSPELSYDYYVRADCDGMDGDVSLWVGPFTFTTPPTCPDPTAGSATNETVSGADLSWTENGPATVWDISVVPAGNPVGALTADNVSNPYTWTGGTSATDYSFYVRADCGMDNSSDLSGWVGPFNFTTLCATYVAPYYEGFNVSSSSAPNCWTNTSSGFGTWKFNSQGTFNQACGNPGASGFAWIDHSSNYSNYLLTVPLMDVSALTTPQLRFDRFMCDASAASPLYVEYYDGAAWQTLASYLTATATTGSGAAGWQEETLDLTPAVSGGLVQIRFHAENNGLVFASRALVDHGLDEIYFEETPVPPANDMCSNAIAVTCNSVTSGSTVNSTNDSQAISCTYSYNGGQGVWYTVAGWGGTMTASTCTGSNFDTKLHVYTGACGGFSCVAGGNDECATQSSVTWAGASSTTYYILVHGNAGAEGDFDLTVTCGDNAFACTENGLTLEFQTDANPNQTTWELLNEAGNLVVLSGGPLNPANSIETNFGCVPDGCYRLRVLDNGGDGMTTGGYILRTTGDNLRIIDNAFNFDGAYDGNVSAISGGQSFCVPLGEGRTIFSSCDKLDWVTNKFIVATANAAVSGQFGVTNTTSGYEFWFYDPNGSYSFRRFRSHSTSDGYGTGATRACHFRLNAWVNSPGTPHLPANVLLNVRIRGRVANVNQAFGPACQFKIDPALAACPRVNLQDNPLSNDFSCGVNKFFGGSNTAGNRITATPPQPIPTVLSSNVRYQFRFRIVGEAVCIIRPPQTSATFYMNWSAASGPQLECNKQYEVDVRVSLDGGATWCFDVASPSCTEPVTPWGDVCMVNIVNSTYCPGPLQGGSSSLAVQNEGDLTMYPNPNRGDQLFINLSEVGADVTTVSVDIYDLTGKRVTARTIQVQDGFVNTAMDLNGAIANGMYMVNITAGDKTYTERLVIQK